jgi:chromosome segregation ATPase
VQRQLDELKHKANTYRQQASTLRQAARGLRDEAIAIKESLDEDELEVYVEYSSKDDFSIDDLEAEITTLEQRLELVHGGNPRIIEEFHKRAETIRTLTVQTEELTAAIVDLDDKIQTIRARWEPTLDELIGKISSAFGYNFEQIGCAGQVDIHKDEDFSQWAIRIHVKFRENETLSVLDSHRQSGGERAVSTIFYLMALQSLARSPFRVVDEINQGMDPRNERMVHGRMVDIACSENTSQYFLITPKLLPGLQYHERMVIHTIYSGEAMPEDNTKLDVRKLAQKALQVRLKA